MTITTRKGDQGSTDLLYGVRVAKSHPRIHALGAVDELNAALGLLRISAVRRETRDLIPTVQKRLIMLMGELATPPGQEERASAASKDPVSADHTASLDALVAFLEKNGAAQIQGWALPGEAGVFSGAHADMARVFARRAERSVVDLENTPEAVPNREILRYLNRLSDVLWLLARWEEQATPSPQTP